MKKSNIKFEINNFRVFENSQLFDFAPITLLIGPNNSGKSSLAKSLLLIKNNLLNGSPSLTMGLSSNEVNLQGVQNTLNKDTEPLEYIFHSDYRLNDEITYFIQYRPDLSHFNVKNKILIEEIKLKPYSDLNFSKFSMRAADKEVLSFKSIYPSLKSNYYDIFDFKYFHDFTIEHIDYLSKQKHLESVSKLYSSKKKEIEHLNYRLFNIYSIDAIYQNEIDAIIQNKYATIESKVINEFNKLLRLNNDLRLNADYGSSDEQNNYCTYVDNMKSQNIDDRISACIDSAFKLFESIIRKELDKILSNFDLVETPFLKAIKDSVSIIVRQNFSNCINKLEGLTTVPSNKSDRSRFINIHEPKFILNRLSSKTIDRRGKRSDLWMNPTMFGIHINPVFIFENKLKSRLFSKSSFSISKSV